ncbi:MAG: DUF975 family protein [Clostridia bacterium]|nr:DUF975 family protein [Clostridia bacterium]
MNISIREMKVKAKELLKDQWGMFTLIELISSLLMNVASLLVGGPLTMGLSMVAVKITKGEKVNVITLFEGFTDFLKVFILYLVNAIYVLLWSLLFIIPGIVKALSYSMCYFILIDSPDITYDEARRRSIEMMRGNKGKLFRLYLSFLGWYILSYFTLGILFLFVMPYIRMTLYQFYQSIAPDQIIDSGITVEIDPNDITF